MILKKPNTFIDLNKWRDCNGEDHLGLNSLSKLVNRLMQCQQKVPGIFTVVVDKLIPKCKWKSKGPGVFKTLFKKNEV